MQTHDYFTEEYDRDAYAIFDLPETKYWKTIGRVSYVDSSIKFTNEQAESWSCVKRYENYYARMRQEEPQIKSPNGMFMLYDKTTRRIQVRANNMAMRNLKEDKDSPDMLCTQNFLLNDILQYSKTINCTFDEVSPSYLSLIDCGNIAAMWMSNIFGNKNLRLGYYQCSYPEKQEKILSWEKFTLIYREYHRKKLRLAPDMPLVKMISMTSIKDVYGRYLGEDELRRDFNPGILITPYENIGPFDELRWKWIKIGDAIFRNANTMRRSNNKAIWKDVKDGPKELKTLMLSSFWDLRCPGHLEVNQDVQVYKARTQT